MNDLLLSEQTVATAVRHSRRSCVPLVLILLVGLCLRIGCAVLLTGTIDSEGAEYARIAENVARARGYAGIATPGKELMFPPLFPFAIGAVTVVTQDAETAGRLVSVMMGTLLILPVYFIGRHLYDRRVALLAAALVACHPLLVKFSATVYCESTYITLLMTAVYWTLRAFRLQTIRLFSAAGIFFGLAYLTRPEAAVYPVVAVVLALLFSRKSRQPLSQFVPRVLWMPAVCAVLASPYILWLHSQTGQWRIEGKSPLNYTTVRRMQTGQAPEEAQYAVDPDLKERGVWIQSNLEIIHSTRFTLREFGHYLRAKAKEVLNYPTDYISGALIFGSPPLFGFAVLGLFRKPWNLETAIDQVFLCTIGVVACGALFGIYYLSIRFLLVLLPILVLWSANGIAGLSRWAESTFRDISGGATRIRWSGAALAAMIPLLSLTTISQAYELRSCDRSSRPVKIAGAWLNAYAPGWKTIVDVSTPLAFHADAQFIPYPSCSSEVALRYFDKRNVDFIVLKDAEVPARPYLALWMERGIPSDRAKLVYSAKAPAIGRILIYRWDRTAGPPRGSM